MPGGKHRTGLELAGRNHVLADQLKIVKFEFNLIECFLAHGFVIGFYFRCSNK
jgi:hypothetical protein